MKRLQEAFARLFVSLLALTSAGWAALFLMTTDHVDRLNSFANQIMTGDRFQLTSLIGTSELLAAAEDRGICNPIEVRSAAIIRLRLFEDAVNESNTKLADARLKLLRSSVDHALSCVPSDGFLWFIRYWSANFQGGPASDHLQELKMSYLLGPFEGWIALRRSPYALAIYESLPPDMKEMVANEFAAIVASGFVNEAVGILRGPGWIVRDELLPRLATTRLAVRIELNKRLRSEGLIVTIPGVVAQEFRPWH